MMEEHLKELFCKFQEQFGTGPGLGPSTGTCLLNVESLPTSFIASLYRAAAALFRTDPWKRLRPAHHFGIRVAKDADWSSQKQPFTCAQLIGGDGGDLGFHLFKSENDAVRVTGVNETVKSPNLELLRVVFVHELLLSQSNKRMIRSLSLESSGNDSRFAVIDVARCTSTGGVRFRNPTVEELKFVFAFMKGIALIHPLIQVENDSVQKRGRLVSLEPFIETVDVQWPPEISKGWSLVAVTISHPPGQVYEEKKRVASPIKYIEPPNENEGNTKWNFLRKCAMCENEVHDDHSVCCGRCRAVVYCSPICQKQHWKETHKNMCGLYKAMMEREEELVMKIFTFSCFVGHPCRWLESLDLHKKGMWRRKCGCYLHCPFGLLPTTSDAWGGLGDGEYPPDYPLSSYMAGNSNPILLSGWSEYYTIRSLRVSSPVAAVLSHPLTLYYVLISLCMNSKNRLLMGKEVIVHYLGPELELDWMPAFAEIGHLLNGLGNIQIVMVGPEVPSNLSGTRSGMGTRIKVNFVRGTYQEQASNLSTPHVVVALNCSLESYGNWNGALELIKSMNVPAFFTERSEILCTDAKQILRAAGLQITYPVTPNPFRSPVQDQAPSSNLPTFSNGFVFGVNT